MFTEKEILDQLDEPFLDLHAPSGPPWLVPPRARSQHTFMLDLEHGYFETAGSYIHLFADEERWAIVMEKTGYNNRSDYIESELVYFGNCVAQVGEYNMLMLPLIDTWLPDDLPSLASIGHFHYESVYQPEVPPSAQETYQRYMAMITSKNFMPLYTTGCIV
ncbi:hypothetical protein DCC81_09860 [Chitinophaga parva]|uniref:Uncharacterized protein n=1 Tax=Chitinophaga parva TaxID=2169414 RepID=A0A2T7BPY2_9BACT|nr:hypothetical protein [Chitinophaga parva]PUZ29722.1 hypothetical protein DCC81_09860 [Chitinophaga parva]